MLTEKMREEFHYFLKRFYSFSGGRRDFVQWNLSFFNQEDFTNNASVRIGTIYNQIVDRKISESMKIIEDFSATMKIHHLMALNSFIILAEKRMNESIMAGNSNYNYKTAIPVSNLPKVLKVFGENLLKVSDEDVFIANNFQNLFSMVKIVFPGLDLPVDNYWEKDFVFKMFLWIESFGEGLDEMSFESQLLILKKLSPKDLL